MTLPVEDCLAAIRSHTHGLAAAAEGNFDRRIEHCPDWTMADLVWHLTSVHWFWNEIAHHNHVQEPEDLVRPARPADADLVPALLRGVAELIDTLRSADQSSLCWTWGQEENVWFITRHQVQEAAVHHWDAVNAAGSTQWEMDPVVAADAVEEFLTHSVANPRWPMPDAEPLREQLRIPMAGELVTITDGPLKGTVVHTVTAGDVAGNAAADVLLWLYGRVPDNHINADPPDALSKLRALSNTD